MSDNQQDHNNKEKKRLCKKFLVGGLLLLAGILLVRLFIRKHKCCNVTHMTDKLNNLYARGVRDYCSRYPGSARCVNLEKNLSEVRNHQLKLLQNLTNALKSTQQ